MSKRFKILFHQRGAHTHMRIFVRELSQATFALCGSVVMRPDEADAFFAALRAEAGPVGSGAGVEIGIDSGLEGATAAEATHV